MESLKISLNKFFESYTSKINTKKIVSMFKVTPENYNILININTHIIKNYPTPSISDSLS